MKTTVMSSGRCPRFLEGKQATIAKDIKRKMINASDSSSSSAPHSSRDQLNAIDRVSAEQKAVSTHAVDEDIIAIARAGNEAWAEVFFVRGGRLLERDNFLLDGTLGETDGEVIAGFIKQFYVNSPVVPPAFSRKPPLRTARPSPLGLRSGEKDAKSA